MPSYPQRDEAEFLAARVPGVTGMRNDIRLIPIPGKRGMKEIICDAFRRNARLRVNDFPLTSFPRKGRTGRRGGLCAKRDEAVPNPRRARAP